MEMAKIGPGVAGGNNRQTLTDADGEGRALFKRWCDAAGLSRGRRHGDDVRAARGDGAGAAAGLCRQPPRHPADRGQVRRGAGGARRAGGDPVAERPRDPDAASDRGDQLDQRGGHAVRAGDAGVGGVRRACTSSTTPTGGGTPKGLRFGDELERIGWKGDEPVGGAADEGATSSSTSSRGRSSRPRARRSASSRTARGSGGCKSR